MKTKILLVDDKSDFRILVKMFLKEKYEVETAEDGLVALKMLQTGYTPNLIVSDLMMPHVDGKTLVNHLRASAVFKKIPIIILSNLDKSMQRVELLNSGASDYIVKPFNPAELEARIELSLRKSA